MKLLLAVLAVCLLVTVNAVSFEHINDFQKEQIQALRDHAHLIKGTLKRANAYLDSALPTTRRSSKFFVQEDNGPSVVNASAPCVNAIMYFANNMPDIGACFEIFGDLFDSNPANPQAVLEPYCNQTNPQACVHKLRIVVEGLEANCTNDDLNNFRVGDDSDPSNMQSFRDFLALMQVPCIRDNTTGKLCFANLISLKSLGDFLDMDEQNGTSVNFTYVNHLLSQTCTKCTEQVMLTLQRIIGGDDKILSLGAFCLKEGDKFCVIEVLNFMTLTMGIDDNGPTPELFNQLLGLVCDNRCITRFFSIANFGDDNGGDNGGNNGGSGGNNTNPSSIDVENESRSSMPDFSLLCDKNPAGEFCFAKIFPVLMTMFANPANPGGGCPFEGGDDGSGSGDGGASGCSADPTLSSLICPALVGSSGITDMVCSFDAPMNKNCSIDCTHTHPCTCISQTNSPSCPAIFQSFVDLTFPQGTSFTCPGENCPCLVTSLMPIHCCNGVLCSSSGSGDGTGSGSGTGDDSGSGDDDDGDIFGIPPIDPQAICSDACKSSLSSLISQTGCCATSYMRAVARARGVDLVDLDLLKFTINKCGLKPPSPCQTQAKVLGKLKLRNFKYAFYLANKAVVDAALQKDIAGLASVDQKDVTVNGVTNLEAQSHGSSNKMMSWVKMLLQSSLAGITVDYSINVASSSKATEVQEAIKATITGETYGYPAITGLPITAREEPLQPVGVDASSANTVETENTPNPDFSVAAAVSFNIPLLVALCALYFFKL